MFEWTRANWPLRGIAESHLYHDGVTSHYLVITSCHRTRVVTSGLVTGNDGIRHVHTEPRHVALMLRHKPDAFPPILIDEPTPL